MAAKSKPVELKILEGNPGKRPLPNIVKPAPGIPKCPAYLSPMAKKWWKCVVPALGKIGILSLVDSTALEIIATAYSNMHDAIEKINLTDNVIETSFGNLQVNPYHSIYKQNAEIYLKFCSEFGLTPNARQKIPSHVDNETDPFETILNS